VARATDADLAVTTMQTTMGQLIGTLQYMSPEQCDANPDLIDTRSDVYALGVILFQLLSNHLPYDLRKLAIHEAVRIIKDEQPITMSTINMLLKGDIETIVIKAMEKDRERRYGSAAEFASDINHFLNNEPIIARPLSMSYQLRLFTKKYKRTCLAASICLVSIVLGLIGTTWQWSVANYERNIANQRYEAILSMSNDFVGDFYEGIYKLNAALPVQKHVLDETLAQLESLRQTSGDTPEIMRSIAKTYQLYGKLYNSSSGANYGDTAKARENYKKSIQIITNLIEQGFSERKGALALLTKYLGDLEFKNAEYAKAESLYEEAAEIIDDYLNEFSEDAGGLRVKNAIENDLLDTLLKSENFDRAQILVQEQIESRQLLAMSEPDNLKKKRDYANILKRAGRLQVKLEEYALAIDFYTRAKDLDFSLVKAEPQNGRAPRDYGWTQFLLGDALKLNGHLLDDKNQVVAGLVSIGSGLSLLRDRCVVYPDDADARDDLALYVSEYITLFSENQNAETCDRVSCKVCASSPEFLVRVSEDCLDILLALQPVVESNPTNYALAELYATLETSYESLDSAKE